MKIVIVGGGQLGTGVIAALSKEGHEISLIDQNQDVIDRLGISYDIMTFTGNGVRRAIQENAGAANADILIAVTDSDEINLLCCLTARKLGTLHTIARVREPEYAEQLDFFGDELGLSLYVNPEESAAEEIASIIKSPGAQQIESFADGKLQIVQITLKSNSKADNVSLMDFGKVLDAKVLVCAVKRGGEVTIPDGSFVLKSGDRVCFAATPEEMNKLFDNLGRSHGNVSRVLIVGGGGVSYYLIEQLLHSKIAITVIESDTEACEILAAEFPNVRVLNADGTDQEFLREEGLESYSAIAALTGDDEDNLILAMYAESIGTKRVIVKLEREVLLPIADRVFSGTTISPKKTAANQIVQYVRAMTGSPGGNIEALHQIVGGQVEALEFSAWRESKVIGIPLKDLKIKKGILIASIVRGEHSGDAGTIIPNGNDVIRADDNVIVVTATHTLNGLDDIISK